MRRQSNKTAALYRKFREPRRMFVAAMGRCAFCGTSANLAAHEMVGGPNRMRAFQQRAAWLALCDDCNCHDATDKAQWPLARQLAVKLEVDPEYFDLDAINALLAPQGHPDPPRSVDAVDVLYWVKRHNIGSMAA